MGVTALGNISDRTIKTLLGDNPTELILTVLNEEAVNEMNRDLVENGRRKGLERFKKRVRIPLTEVLGVQETGIVTTTNFILFENIAAAGHDLDRDIAL